MSEVLGVLFVGSLLTVCIAGPLMLSSAGYPAAGAGVAMLGFLAWLQLGPPPMPGMLNGTVCVTGVFSVALVFVICLARAIWLLVAF